MTYTDIVNKVSEEVDISPEIVNKVYKAFWLYIKNSVQELPLKEELTETEFSNLRTNFNIPSLGKLCCTYPRYLGIKNKFNYIRNIRDKK